MTGPDSAPSSTSVSDLNGYVYPLGQRIGQGGQGDVFESVHGWIAIKLFRTGSGRRADALAARVAEVRRMPLDALPIARPLATLAPPMAGYAMRLLTGMVPVSRLIRPAPGSAAPRDWYLDTGGLRRRLKVLARLARAVADLHALGLTYGDPSPNNFLVSSDVAESEVRLIDADNIATTGGDVSQVVYTPGYGAPELVTGRVGQSFASDVWALAVVAFEVLALNHPFVGQLVDDGEPELEEAAYRGDLPWIEDPDDARNRVAQNRGMPTATVLSPRLRALFQQCFGPGRHDPALRPSAGQFTDVLKRAERWTLACAVHTERAPATYFANSTTCPWCGERRPPSIFLRIHRWDPEAEVPLDAGLGRPESLVIEVGTVWFLSTGFEKVHDDRWVDDVALSVECTAAGVLVRNLEGGPIEVRSPDGLQTHPIATGGSVLPFPQPGAQSWRVHAGPLTMPHNYLTLTAREGGHGTR